MQHSMHAMACIDKALNMEHDAVPGMGRGEGQLLVRNSASMPELLHVHQKGWTGACTLFENSNFKSNKQILNSQNTSKTVKVQIPESCTVSI